MPGKWFLKQGRKTKANGESSENPLFETIHVSDVLLPPFFSFRCGILEIFQLNCQPQKKMDQPMSTFISFSMDAFSFKQMSKSSWASALVRVPRPLGAPRNLLLTKSSLLKLITRWKFLLVQTAKMYVFSSSKKKAKVFELVLRSILRNKILHLPSR